MITFLVEDMTCGHCEATLRKALGAIDPEARVQIDLPSHLLQVESARLDSKAISDAISAEGYTPQQR